MFFGGASEPELLLHLRVCRTSWIAGFDSEGFIAEIRSLS